LTFFTLEEIYSLPLGIVGLSVLVLLLLGSAWISASEAAFFSLSQKQIVECQNAPHNAYATVIKLVRNPSRTLATILMVNNLVNVAFIILSTYILWKYFEPEEVPGLVMLVYTLVFTTLIVLFGEIIPKTYATQNNVKFAKKAAPFMHFIIAALSPLVNILIKISQGFGKIVFKKQYDLSIEQLNKAVELTTAKESSASEKTILKGIMNFNNLTVRKVMQPRTEITAVDLSLNFTQLVEVINQSGYSRFPVYQETIDNIVGFLYTKDLLPYLPSDASFAWQGLLRKCFFVPEKKRLATLLLEFQESKIHIAIVVDEYGGTSGLVTMEDIIEEIIGEIGDEFDHTENYPYKKLNHQTFEFEGKILMNDFCKILEVDPALFETVRGESESLGGLLLELHKGLPNNGEKITYKQFTFTILAADTRKIKKVKVFIAPTLAEGKPAKH
jgi:putative hemolysin